MKNQTIHDEEIRVLGVDLKYKNFYKHHIRSGSKGNWFISATYKDDQEEWLVEVKTLGFDGVRICECEKSLPEAEKKLKERLLKISDSIGEFISEQNG